GAELWLRYVSLSLAHTAGQPRLFVFYEDVMREPTAQLPRLRGFLRSACARADYEPAPRGLIDEESQHYSTSAIETVDDPRLPFAARALYLVLRTHVSATSSAGPDAAEGHAGLSEALDHFAHYSVDMRLPSPDTLQAVSLLQQRHEAELA